VFRGRVARLADIVVVTAWLFVLAQNLLFARRGGKHPAADGRLRLGLLVLLAAVVFGARLEYLTGGRLVSSAVLAALGAFVAVAGAVVHVRARSAIGPAWSSAIEPSGETLVVEGPYRVVRHPLYAGVLLLTLGTVLAHPSAPTLCGALGMIGGLAVKIGREERSLAARFGDEWTAYRARVPCVVPRLRRRLSSGTPR
jgi:protein-S-isoprenylcysteine O-methyltransferase Ste14